MNINSVLVFDDRQGEPIPVGNLIFDEARGRAGITSTFTYDPAWLTGPAYAIDPALSVVGRTSTVPGLPGCFQDCSPDRWGRNLIAKGMRALALRSGGASRDMNEVDYLLGVSDLTRQGALRLRAAADEPFLGSGTDVPKLLELPRLLRAADAITRDPDDQSAIKDLLDAGSGSLGGARPKASVRDGSQLMIAKFPHPDDTWDVMAWEAVALDLAADAGITVPRRRTTSIDRRTVLILDRFDRTAEGHRLPYVSAMTLLGRADGTVSDYTDVCDAITDHGSSPNADLAGLWLRVAFSVAIHNTDDHMRNHGFTRKRGGWTFSPLFDVNPEPNSGKARVTGIGGAREPSDEALGLRVLAVECRLDDQQVSEAAVAVHRAVSTWRKVASRHGISPSEQKFFEESFDRGLATVGSLI